MKLNSISLLLLSTLAAPAMATDSDYEKALAAYQQQDIEAAYIHLKNTLQQAPNNLPAKLLFANVLIDKQFYKEAELELRSALSQGADRNLVVEPLCIALLRRGQFTQVLSVFDEGRLDGPASKAYRLAKASALIGLKRMPEALDLYQSLLQQHQSDMDVRLGLVSAFISDRQFHQAEQVLSPLVHLAKQNDKVARYLGTLAFERGDFERALSQYRQAQALDATNLLTLRGLANSYLALEQLEQAKEVVAQIIELTPYDPQAKLLQAKVFSRLDQAEGAEQVLAELTDQLSTLDQTFMLSQPQLMLVDAMASYGQRNYEQARKKFRRYLAQSDDDFDIRAVVLLADVFNKLQQPKQALNLLAQHQERLVEHKSYALLLVGEYLKHEQELDAADLLVRLRQLYDQDAGVLLLEAHLLSKRGQINQAIELLAASTMPKDASYQHTLAVLYLNAGQVRQSFELINALVAATPDNIEYRLLQARIQLELGQGKVSADNIVRLKQSHGQNPEVRLAYAKLLFSQGNKAKAKQELEQLTAAHPDNEDFRLALAEVAFSLNRVSEATELLQTLLRSQKYQREAYFKLALIYLQENDWQNCLDATGQLLRLDRLDAQAMFVRAQALLATGQHDAATTLTAKLSAMWQADWRSLVKLSRLQRQLMAFDEAALSLNKARELAPESGDVLMAQVRLDIRRGSLDTALSLLATPVAQERISPVHHTLFRGDIAVEQHHWNKAFEQYAATLKIDSDNPIAFMGLYRLSSLPELAPRFATIAEATVTKHAEKAFFRSKLADFYMVSGQWIEAKRHYLDLITQSMPHEQRGLALNNLAVIYTAEQGYPQAVQFSQQALKLLPKSASVLDTAGWALTLDGKPDDGLYLLRQAYSMTSSDPEVLYHLAYALVQLNKQTEAKRILKRLGSIETHRFKQEAAQLLAKLEG